MKVEITEKQRSYLNQLTQQARTAQQIQVAAMRAMAPDINVAIAAVVEEDGKLFLTEVTIEPEPET